MEKLKKVTKTRQQSGRMAKNKGANFERFVAKLFEKWWGSKFYRTPMSGGSQLKDGFNMAGDLCTDDVSFPFHIECKKQEKWELAQLFVSEVCRPWAWLKQCLKECPDGHIPLLIMTKNQYPIWVMMLMSTWAKRPINGFQSMIYLHHGQHDLVMFPLVDFFNQSTPAMWGIEKSDVASTT